MRGDGKRPRGGLAPWLGVRGGAALAVWASILAGPSTGRGQEREAVLPFSSGETTETLTIVVRHKVQWDRANRRLSWERLEADFGTGTRFSVAPGSVGLTTGTERSAAMRLVVQGGSVEAEPRRRADSSWVTPVRIQLGPRDIDWNDPLVEGRGIALEADLVLDSRLEEGPLPTLESIELKKFVLDSLEAGPYRMRNAMVRGQWNRPRWRLDRFSADLFGGQLVFSGFGEWGTTGPPLVSLEVAGEGIDLSALFAAFDLPRASEFQARVSGRARLEARGKNWRVLEFDLHGEEGTVFLDRKLIYDIFEGGRVFEIVTRDELDEVLDASFGEADPIPFDELGFEGKLGPRVLHSELPMANEALGLLIEFNIAREILWDIYDKLLEAGVENVSEANVRYQGATPSSPEEN